VTTSLPVQAVRRVAELQLRGSAGPLPARVCWPAGVPGDGPPALLVCYPGGPDRAADEALCRGLCAQAGLVALWTTRPMAAPDATAVLEWAADHAADLDADPRRLLVAGRRGGGGQAAAVALHARDERWPALARQVLVLPDFRGRPLDGDDLAGVAPATVVSGRRAVHAYAERLRAAGVAVQELRPAPDRVVGALAAALRPAEVGA
jgi:acetyl esterase/lipase